MKSHMRGVALLVGAAVLLVSATARAEAVTLRFKFTEGQVLNFKQVEKSVTQAMGMEMTQEFGRYIEWTVQKVEEGVATISAKLTRITINSSNPMSGDQKFDSESGDEPADIGSRVQSLLVGKPYTIKIDLRGKVIEVKGMTKIVEEIVKKLIDESPDDPSVAMGAQMLKGQLNDENLKQEMTGGLNFPEEAVEVGAEWKSSSELSVMGMKIKSGGAYKFESVDGKIVKVSITGTIAAGESEEEGESEGMMAGFKITEGKVTGSIEFDTELGQVRKETSTSKIKLSSPMGEMPVEATSTKELVEKAPVKETGEKESGEGGEEEE